MKNSTNRLPVRYFSVKNEYNSSYCDALLDTEAGIKVVLARHNIDDIYIIAQPDASDSNEDLTPVHLRHGRSLYSSDRSLFSTYHLLQYRLALFADELDPDLKNENDLLPEDVRKKLIPFIQDFQEKNAAHLNEKYNRLFDLLSNNDKILETFWISLFSTFPELKDNSFNCMQWVKNYLYRSLKSSAKLELLPVNQDVCLHFVPEDDYNEAVITDDTDINLYIFLNSEDTSDTLILLNVLNILVSKNINSIHLKKIYELQDFPSRISNVVHDNTSAFGITEPFHAISAFLNYGKADMIVRLWEKSHEKDDYIDTMVYSMRHVDVGLSLCNISEMESGILNLRKLFHDAKFWQHCEDTNPLFKAFAECIMEDYGTLLEGDGDIPFIDLVKWAYRHMFYQQTLTLIESSAPASLIKSGIFYYCNNEALKPQVISTFAKQRLKLKPSEYYKMDDIDHYFIKDYIRAGNRFKGNRDMNPLRLYAILRAGYIDNTDPDFITSFTACDSRKTLENVLFAYYNIGQVRNKINHAESGVMSNSRLMKAINDESPVLLRVKDSIEYFIASYDKAIAEVQNKNPQVIRITRQEVRKAADQMKNDFSAPGRERIPAQRTPAAQNQDRTE